MFIYIDEYEIVYIKFLHEYTTEDPKPLGFSPTLRQVDERDAKVEAVALPKNWAIF